MNPGMLGASNRHHRFNKAFEKRNDETLVRGRTMAIKILSRIAAVAFAGFISLSLGLAGSPQMDEEEPVAEISTGQAPPSTRAEMLRMKREEKVGALVTPTQGIVEKYAKNFDRKGSNSVEDVNFWGFHPRLDWIARGSGAALGVRYWKPELVGPVDVMGSAFYSWRRYQHYDLNVGLIPNRGKRIPSRSFENEGVEQLGDIDRGKFSRFKLYATGRYRDRTDESFYGPGPDSLKDNRTYYRVKDVLLEAVTGVQLTAEIGFTFKAGFLQHSLADGRSDPSLWEAFSPGSPSNPGLPGQENPPNYWRYHTSFLMDFRDDPGVPHKGIMVAFGWEKFDNINTLNLYNFHRFGIDIRGYIPLGSRQRVLALRAVGVDSDPASGNQIPFFLQPSLGGGESLRGYDAFRFQGDKMVLLQGEYRWEASRRVELAFFGDTGTVSNQGERLSINKMKSDAGIGFRFKSSRATLFRLDLARSNEGYQIQFRFSAPF